MSLSYKYKRVPVVIFSAAFGAAAWAQTPPGSDTLEEIIVTGTRAALAESLDRKGARKVVQDSIVAEDLGRFPDDNVADSLSHITGITLQRTRGGEGQYVNVRGLGPDVQHRHAERPHPRDRRRRPRVRLRRAAVRDHLRRRRVQVRRCGAARRQHRRRDQSHFRAAARHSRAAHFGSRSKATTTICPRTPATKRAPCSAIRSRTTAWASWSPAVYQDSEVRSDAVHEFSINPDSPGEFDANGDGEISADESDLLGLCCTSFGARIQQKQRTGVTAVWQWQAADNSQHERRRHVHAAQRADRRLSPVVLRRGLDPRRRQARTAGATSPSAITGSTGMTVAELVPELSTITEHRVVDTTQFGWNAAWQASRAAELQLSMPISSKSERDSGGKDTWVVSGIAGSHIGRVRHEQQRPAGHQRHARGRPRLRDGAAATASSATKTSACTTSACRART